MARLLLLAALLASLGIPPAMAGTAAVSEKAWEDRAIGFSIQPLRGWEPKAKKNPDDPLARNDAGGWYSKDPDWRGAECSVLRFGSFFGEGSRTVATEDAEKKEGERKPDEPRAPRTTEEMFGKGLASFDAWYAAAQKGCKARGDDLELAPTPAKFGEDQGVLYEGRLLRRDGSRILVYGASVRRGSFEVAVIYEAFDGKDFVRDLRGAYRASTRSLRILPDKVMRKAEAEMAKKLQGSSAEEAWAEKAIANLPKGWKHSRTEHYV